MKFGDRLKELRLSFDMTQKELGDKLNISDRVIGYYESNDRFPKDQEIITDIAKLFNVSIDYLMGVSNNPKGEAIEQEEYVPTTIAAHFDGDDELTDEEVQQIEEFIEFVKQRKKKND